MLCRAHAVTLFFFVLGRRHVRNATSVGRVGTWLAASLGLELAALAGELEAKLGTEAAPIPTAAWPQPWPSAARGNGLAH